MYEAVLCRRENELESVYKYIVDVINIVQEKLRLFKNSNTFQADSTE